jgi:glycosyltransferase involved in cell wall biosynthesis
MNSPRLSIVSVVLNDEHGIGKTIDSILNQTYTSFELIIIDGASSDATLEIISRYKGIDKVISEPDKGIYDAMNRALSYCRGEWVNFMNSGDRFFSAQTIENVFSSVNLNTCDIIYGDYIADYEQEGVSYIRATNTEKFWRRRINHQSVIMRSSIPVKFRFDPGYRYSSDFDLLYKAYKAGFHFVYYPQPLAVCKGGGLSDRNRIQAVIESYSIARKMESSEWITWELYGRLITEFFKSLIKKVLPIKIKKGMREKLHTPV